LNAIAEKKDLSDDIVAKLKPVLQQFTESFKVTAGNPSLREK
jgi:hypothetical protein